MTVKELIEHLSGVPDYAEVCYLIQISQKEAMNMNVDINLLPIDKENIYLIDKR